MEYRTLWKAGIRRHKGGLLGIFLLIFLVALSLGTVLTVWSNSGRYVSPSLASMFGVELGGEITFPIARAGAMLHVFSDSGSGDYVVSGIYSCANDMGANVGLSQAGYLKIGKDDPQIWRHHFFLADPTQKAAITQSLEDACGGDVHIHENTWPGLFGIISAMGALVAFLYVMVAAFILVVTVMTGGKLLAAEQRDIGIYQAIGFPASRLRLSFALRFGITALLGVALAAVLTDPLASGVMKLAGVSNFASYPTAGSVLAPALSVVLLFTAFAYLAAGKIKKTDVTVLITE